MPSLNLSLRLPSTTLLLIAGLLWAGCDDKGDGSKTGDDTAGNGGNGDPGTDADQDGFTADVDCDDGDDDIHPDAEEICDDVDNNCNQTVDENVLSRFYEDSDGDGFGNPSVATQACAPGAGYVADDTDCDDTNANAYPTAQEYCDSFDQDEDCDGMADDDDDSATGQGYYYADSDGDGHGSGAASVWGCNPPAGYTDNDRDCNDNFGDADPEAHCWTGTWSGDFNVYTEIPKFGGKDACLGTVSLTIDASASPMITGTATCTSATLGAMTYTITGNIDATDHISGDIDAVIFKAPWSGSINEEQLTGDNQGVDKTLGFPLYYDVDILAMPQ